MFKNKDMEKIGLFFGSDSGVTDDITRDFINFWEDDNIEMMEIGDASVEDFEQYNILFFGLSTWYDGDLQSDWEAFFDEFQTIDFTNKIVAIYGLGDQIGYAEYFVDGIGILAKVVLENGGKVIGYWPTEGYRHTDSVALVEGNDSLFYGLALDHDNESQLTDSRITKWITQVRQELDEALV